MYELTIELRSDTGRCLYEQIYDHIKQEIRVGRLSVGERLPSTRSMAEYLQIARSTVDLAYEQLVSEGYIEARPYKGYFVCRVEELFQFTEAEGKGQQPERRMPVSHDVKLSQNGAGSSPFYTRTIQKIVHFHKNPLRIFTSSPKRDFAFLVI